MNKTPDPWRPAYHYRSPKRNLALALFLAAAILALLLALPGCGNVYLSGEAMTAAETSALDAYEAAARAREAGPTIPAFVEGYLYHNFIQWQSFVRAAKNDIKWGPNLTAPGTIIPAPGTPTTSEAKP